MEAAFDHVVLEVRDVAASVEYYHDLLGFQPVRLPEFLAGSAPFASVRVNRDTLIDFFPQAMWDKKEGPQNPNHIALTFSKTEVVALKQKMKARGLPIERTLEESFGARGIGRSIYFRDPEGILLEARHYGDAE